MMQLKEMGLEEGLIQEMQSVGRFKKILKGNTLMHAGTSLEEVPFVLSGLLKVYRMDNEQSGEVLLYYLTEGETCAMSISCCMDGNPKEIQVVAEKDSELLLVPNHFLDAWLTKYRSFKKYIFSSYQKRFDELLENIDSLVFTNLEERLWKYLLDTQQATGSFEIHKTHEVIAKDLGTSRVVVSRLLKKLEISEQIQQARNRIDIL